MDCKLEREIAHECSRLQHIKGSKIKRKRAIDGKREREIAKDKERERQIAKDGER